MAEAPAFEFPASTGEAAIGEVVLRDESDIGKWRTWRGRGAVPLGRSQRVGGDLVFSVAPGEWIVVGDPPDDEAVDLTHIRALIGITGPGARSLLSYVCALDLGDLMTPDGAAARTLVAGVGAEIVREDVDGDPRYVVLVSRSFARAVWERLVQVAERLA